MRIREGFLLREVGGAHIVVPFGERVVDFNGLITLNDTGRLLWECLQQGSDSAALAIALTEKYEATPEQAQGDVAAFVEELRANGLIVD